LAYNVAGLPEGISKSNPEANAPLIGRFLNDYDVVLTQEDFGFYTNTMRAETDHEFLSVPHPGPDRLNPVGRDGAITGDGLNVLSDFPIDTELDRVPWTNCGDASADCLALKGFAVTTMDLGADAAGGASTDGHDPNGDGDGDALTVELISLHLEAGGVDSALRAENLELLAEYLQDQAPGRPVIIGGDWNLRTDEEPDATQYEDFLEATGLQDACSTVECGEDVDVIDKVAYRSSDRLTLTPTSHAFERERFVDGDGEPLSDHDPLHVDFDWETSAN